MTIWLDAHLSPAIVPWMRETFGLDAIAVRDVGLRDEEDEVIFFAARTALAVVLTKDADFLNLLERFGPPPQVIWLTCGNTSNARLKQILLATLPQAVQFLEFGDRLVEIGDA